MWRSRLFVFTSGFVNPTSGLSGKFSFLRCIQNRARQVYRYISNFLNCQKSNTLLDYGNMSMVSMSWNVNTFGKLWVAVCYWVLWQIFFSRITMVMAEKIISYCIHHTKTSGYSIAQLCSYSIADWTTEESTIDTLQGKDIFLFFKACRPALRLILPPTQWKLRSLWPSNMLSEREPHHSLPSSYRLRMRTPYLS
jgi:hypothetical protein